MQEDTKISDLTVAEFRQLMAQCFQANKQKEYADTWGRAAEEQAKAISRRQMATFNSPYGGILGD